MEHRFHHYWIPKPDEPQYENGVAWCDCGEWRIRQTRLVNAVWDAATEYYAHLESAV